MGRWVLATQLVACLGVVTAACGPSPSGTGRSACTLPGTPAVASEVAPVRSEPPGESRTALAVASQPPAIPAFISQTVLVHGRHVAVLALGETGETVYENPRYRDHSACGRTCPAGWAPLLACQLRNTVLPPTPGVPGRIETETAGGVAVVEYREDELFLPTGDASRAGARRGREAVGWSPVTLPARGTGPT